MSAEFMGEWSQVDPDSVAMDNMFDQDEVVGVRQHVATYTLNIRPASR